MDDISSEEVAMSNNVTKRARHEIDHGRMLAEGDTEAIWGWGTPAGQVRAGRRGDLVAQAAGLAPGVRALEVGCGTGLFTEMFAQSGAHIVAVDISPELIEKASQRDLPEDRVRFLCQRFEDTALDDPFDAVVGSSILHHLEIDPALKTIYNLLRPGGIMAFAEPNMLNPQVFAERTFWRRFSKYTSPDETAFVRWLLKRRLQEAGFNEVEIFPYDWLHPYTPEGMIEGMLSLSHLLEKVPVLKEFSGSLVIRARRP